ncbi:hypothetical protein PIB30_086715, partial [Stylosanthes scabra]|nr:hypothetical protein [Stylosanthes scabra]
MLESAIGGRRRRGGRERCAGGDGVDTGGGDQAEPFTTRVGTSGQHLGEASGSAIPQTPGASTQGYVEETQPDFGSPGASFFDGILSPTSMEQQFGQEAAYYADLARCLQESLQAILRPSTDQIPPHLPIDLNELASDLLGDFSFVLGGTPPSAFVDVPPQVDHDILAQEGEEERAPEPLMYEFLFKQIRTRDTPTSESDQVVPQKSGISFPTRRRAITTISN